MKTRDEMRIVGLFNGSWTKLSSHALEKYFENPAPVWRTKIAQFRTHYLTKELPYVSTQQSG
jgi:hypothetical protein